MDLFCAPCVTRQPSAHVYFGMTKSLCSTCQRAVDAKIQFEDDQVWFHKYCPAHGHDRQLASSSVEWYLDALSFLAPSTPPEGALRPVRHGCPFDCGPCASHLQRFEPPASDAYTTSDLDAVPQLFRQLLSSPHTTLVIEHAAIADVHAVFRAHTEIVPTDFVPSPLAHPHCFSMLYLLANADGTYAPLARVLGRERLFDLLADGHDLRSRVEGDVRAVHVHALMDARTFDVGRVMRCSVPSEGNIPLCAARVTSGDPPKAGPGYGNSPISPVTDNPSTERRALPIVR